MRKFKFIALMLVCALLFSGCSLVSIDEDRVENQVVAVVNGEKIYKYQVSEDDVKYYVQMMLYYNYGMTEDQMDADTLKQIYDEQRKAMLDQLVMDKLLVQKAKELGITLTEDELAENRADADEYFKNTKDGFIEQVIATPTPEPTATPEATPTATPEPTPTATPENTESATTESAATTPTPSPSPTPSPTPTATPEPTPTPVPTPMPSLNAGQQAQVDDMYQDFLNNFGYTPDTYYEYLNNNDLIAKVKEWIDDQTVVTDEAALEWYNGMVEQQKAATEEDPSVFETYVHDNNIITYIPAETVAVKQVFFKFTDADLVEEAKALYENDQKDKALELLQGQIDELMPLAVEAQQKLQGGANIDDLIAERNGDDPGMDNEPTKTYGYLVEERTSTYVDEFVQAALGLFDVGAVSEPTISYMGIHVLQSINVYHEGQVAFDDIKEKIKTALLPDAKDKKYTELTDQWLSEAKVTYHYDLLG